MSWTSEGVHIFKDGDSGMLLNLSIGDVPSVLSGRWFLVNIVYLSACIHRLMDVAAGHLCIECNSENRSFSVMSLMSFSSPLF